MAGTLYSVSRDAGEHLPEHIAGALFWRAGNYSGYIVYIAFY